MTTLNSAVNCLLADNEQFRFVAVKFRGSTKVYHYKTLLADLEKGDLLVVPVGAQEAFKVVEVVELVDFDDVEELDVQYRWTVAKLDTTMYGKCIAMEDGVRKQQRKHTQRAALAALAALFNDVSEEDADALKKLTRL